MVQIPAIPDNTDFSAGYFFSSQKNDVDEGLPSRVSALTPHPIITKTELSNGDVSTWSDFSEPEAELNKGSLAFLEPLRPNMVKRLMYKFFTHQRTTRTRTQSLHGNATITTSSLHSSGEANLGVSRPLAPNLLKRNNSRDLRRNRNYNDDDGQSSRKSV